MNSVRIAELFVCLMREELGYERFGAAGGDIGSRITRLMASSHPQLLTGIHLTDIGFQYEVAFPPPFQTPPKSKQII